MSRQQRFDIAANAELRVLRARPMRCVCPACDPDDEPGGDDLDGGYPARSPK